MLFALVVSVVAFVVVLSLPSPNGLLGEPIRLFLVVWLGAILLTSWNPLRYDTISSEAWVLISAGILSAVVGYVVTRVPAMSGRSDRERHPDRKILAATEVERGLDRVWVLLVAGSAVMYAFYLLDVARSFGLSQIPQTLVSVRTSLGTGEFRPTARYFYYLAEPAVVLGVALGVSHARRSRWVYVGVSSLILLSLFTLSGRTNSLKTLGIALFTALLLSERKRGAARRLVSQLRRKGRAVSGPTGTRQLLVVIAGVIAGVALFVGFGNLLGKSWENSVAKGRLGGDAGISGPFALPVAYLSGPIPAFSATLEDPLPSNRGLVSRPVGQLSELFFLPIRPRSSSVQDPVQIPDEFNVTTYAGPLWLEYGWFGVVVGSFMMGMLAGYSARRFARLPNLGTASCLSLVSVMLIFSVYDGIGWALSWWSQFAFFTVIGAWIVLRSRVPRSSGLSSSGVL